MAQWPPPPYASVYNFCLSIEGHCLINLETFIFLLSWYTCIQVKKPRLPGRVAAQDKRPQDMVEKLGQLGVDLNGKNGVSRTAVGDVMSIVMSAIK